MSRIPYRVLEQLLPTLIEALSNVARHANATSVEITISVADDEVELVVADNGEGIDPGRARGNRIDNIRARARRLAGTAAFAANHPGTRLTWTASIRRRAEDPLDLGR